MNQIEILQNSTEWLKLRHSKIGASDANAIMGVSNYTTPLQLWKQKTNPFKEDQEGPNFVQKRGHDFEPKIRAMLEIEKGYDFPPMVIVSEHFPRLMASLDGYCKELNEIAEFKYVGEEDFEKVLNGKCLVQYIPQIQQQLMLSGARKCRLMVACDDKDSPEKGTFKFAWIDVYPNENYMRSELLPKLNEFVGFIDDKKEPPLTREDPLDQSDDEKLKKSLLNLKSSKEVLELAEKEESEKEIELKKVELYNDYLKAKKSRLAAEKTIDKRKLEILTFMKHERVSCGSVKLLMMPPKETVTIDYERFVKDMEIYIPDEYITRTLGKSSIRITDGTTANN